MVKPRAAKPRQRKRRSSDIDSEDDPDDHGSDLEDFIVDDSDMTEEDDEGWGSLVHDSPTMFSRTVILQSTTATTAQAAQHLAASNRFCVYLDAGHIHGIHFLALTA